MNTHYLKSTGTFKGVWYGKRIKKRRDKENKNAGSRVPT
tara:strand:- start:6344 stop:6460 length:117 start_codon:yes stop_codon:yes gene_type:complete